MYILDLLHTIVCLLYLSSSATILRSTLQVYWSSTSFGSYVLSSWSSMSFGSYVLSSCYVTKQSWAELFYLYYTSPTTLSSLTHLSCHRLSSTFRRLLWHYKSIGHQYYRRLHDLTKCCIIYMPVWRVEYTIACEYFLYNYSITKYCVIIIILVYTCVE